MIVTRRAMGLGGGLFAVALHGAARAQEAYPGTRPVTVVAPFAAGGSTDFVARLIAQELGARLGGSFVVDNRAGASGTVGAGTVARAKPDGFTLLMAPNSTFAMAPFLMSNLGYDAERAFAPISLLATNGMFVCVKSGFAAKTLPALVAQAKAAPGRISYGSGGVGVSNHLAVEIFAAATGIDLLHVPYRGGAPAMQALLAGEVQLSFVDTVTALPYLQSGELRALAVTTAQRAAQAPEVPTIAESGVPGYRASTDFALFAPAGTPEPILKALSDAAVAAMRSPQVRERLAPLAIDPVGGSRAEFAGYLAEESAKWGAIIKARNIRLD
ncbi:Bug family tripartite tricarboxylate transporter substrate binding protein [Roseicella aquatilis]|uniref:Tripartite tricarboxylate transporter substrate binding protein n=1 Tax=Roseicella aquatilis TaxID=2527868 RepID=A0A4R4D8H9_9PROT|nr:tripartite tricarboxylate transporter substrate binding protein [Roseicella aquatilis]TCZ56618.1 tripartite tricarboxylate transporter substrate binding protein [Roseicella aquatilis]